MKIPLTPIRFLRYAREQLPDKVGVVCGDERFTYAQVAERAARLAGTLIAAGAKPDGEKYGSLTFDDIQIRGGIWPHLAQRTLSRLPAAAS